MALFQIKIVIRTLYEQALDVNILRSKDGKEKTSLTSAYHYLTGGIPLAPRGSMDNWISFNGDIYDGLATYGLPGDSGSPLFAYDAKEKRWVLAAVLSTFANYDRTENIYTIIQPDVIAQAFQNDEIQIPFVPKRFNGGIQVMAIVY